MKKNLNDDQSFNEIYSRIEGLDESTKPLWGKMTAAQMFAHCAEALEVSNGEKELTGTPFLFRALGGLFKIILLSEKPFAKNAATHPQYKVTTPKEHSAEKQRLLGALSRCKALGRRDFQHPIFGLLKENENGWLNYKHLDHHLRQFGV